MAIFITLMAGYSHLMQAGAQSCDQVEYKLLATTRANTLEKELNEVAQQGFRFEREAQAIGLSTLTVLVARPHGAATAQRYAYKTVNPTEFRKRQLALSTEGFIFRAAFLPSVLSLGGPNPVFLLERELDVDAGLNQHEYDFVVSPKEKKLQTLLDNANSAGFAPIALFGGFVIVRRDLRNPAAEMGRREYRLLSTYKISTLEKELNEAASQGFRLMFSSAMNGVLLSRDYQALEQRRYEYKLVALRASESANRELNELSQQGFRLRGATQYGETALLEKPVDAKEAARVAFKVLDTRTEATMQKELQDACAQGFAPVNITGGSGRFMTLLARMGK